MKIQLRYVVKTYNRPDADVPPSVNQQGLLSLTSYLLAALRHLQPD